ncbi:MAG: hypothetical protein ACI9TH_002991 [Kiritimatiellia bacterium]|jgi:uncharacterized protein (TIGR01777 family)
MNVRGKKIVLAGGSGFLGAALARHFAGQENEVVVLTRHPSAPSGPIRFVGWDGQQLGDWLAELDGADILINLTGRSVDCRYNPVNRREILHSRLDATHVLGEAIRACKQPPAIWLNAASATIYTDTRGDTPANTEAAGVIGEGFSVDVCTAWEKTFNEEDVPGVRKILMRIAIVLGEEGAMVPMTRLARFGLGGRMGSGEQFMSWLHTTDFVGMVEFLIEAEDAEGVYNLASPFPVTNAAFMRVLRAAVGRSFGIPSPAWLLELGARVIKTETELILKSRKVIPERLMAAGFTLDYPTVEQALPSLISRRSSRRQPAVEHAGQGTP